MSDVIIVLGMHRTGTSSVAGTLVKIGGNAPQHLMPNSAFNERGYFESHVIAQFNDEILASAGTCWDDWREFNPDWYNSTVAANFRLRARNVFEEEFGTALLPVVKDPRICRFFPFWRQVFEDMGKTVHVVMPLRSPWDTAKSLNQRNKMHMAHVILLWLRHVLDAEIETRGLPRSIFNWQDFLGDWRGTCDNISSETGLSWPRLSDRSIAEVEHFLSRDLQHHVSEEKAFAQLRQVNHWALEAFEALRELGQSPQSQTAQTKLTAVRDAFNDAGAIFGRVLVEYEMSMEETNLALAASVEECEVLQHAQHEAAAQHGHRVIELQAALERANHDSQRLKTDLEAMSDAAEAITQAADRHTHRIGELQAALEHANDDRQRLENDLSSSHAEYQELAPQVDMLLQEVKRTRETCDSREADLSHQQRVLEEKLINTQSALSAAKKRLKQPLLDKLDPIGADRRLARKLIESGLFDVAFYKNQRKDLAATLSNSPIDVALHFVTEGFAQGLKPNAFFDTHWYLAQNEDVRNSGINPLWHYHINGWKEGRDPTKEFSTAFYLETYHDIRLAKVNPLQHFLRDGMREGRIVVCPD